MAESSPEGQSAEARKGKMLARQAQASELIHAIACLIGAVSVLVDVFGQWVG